MSIPAACSARFRNRTRMLWQADGLQAVLPGDLCLNHAKAVQDPAADGCLSCHAYFSPLSSDACLSCHKTVARFNQEKLGYHGTLGNDCVACHPDHRGTNADIRGLDRERFSHDLARYRLEGKHATVACKECHLWSAAPEHSRSLRYLDLPYAACTDCHANPHRETTYDSCKGCHVPDGWQDPHLRFVHDRDSRYPLKGKHAAVACVKCHPRHEPGPEGRLLLTGVGQTCVDCHSDPHRSKGSSACARCHTVDGWRSPHLVYAEDPHKRYPLTGAHAPAACKKCHKPSEDEKGKISFTLSGFDTRCVDCHANPHQTATAHDCQRCHTTKSWRTPDILFVHDRDSTYHLLGKHATTACDKCHRPAKPPETRPPFLLKQIGEKCVDCHKDPHRQQFKESCETCHSEKGWKGEFVVDSHLGDDAYLLAGQHAKVTCLKCHPPAAGETTLAASRMAKTPTTCVACHPDPHRGELSTECQACHNEHGWKGTHLRFDHAAQSRYRIDGIHKTIGCAECHPAQSRPQYRPLEKSCEGCHPRTVALIRGQGKKRTRPDPHAGRVRCEDCHPPAVNRPSAEVYAGTCVRCHGPTYRALYLDWQQAFAVREKRALAAIDGLTHVGAATRARLTQRVRLARETSFHNLQLARDLWDAVIREAEALSQDPQRGEE